MTEKTESTGIPSLIKVDLETYIILPLQIAHKSGSSVFDAENFRQYLEDSGHWQRHTSIHAPDFIAKQGMDTEALKCIRYQAYNYFHPFVRSFWYDENLVQCYRHGRLKTLKAQFNSLDTPITLDATADFYHFQPDIGILVLHLKAKEKLLLKDAQNCLDRLRRIYPPYFGKKGNYGGHFPDSVELIDAEGNAFGQYANDQIADLLTKAQVCEEMQSCNDESKRAAHQLLTHGHILATHWAELLQPLGADSHYQVLQLGDDRAALASKINLFPNQEIPLTECVDRGNLIRLCFADASGSDHLPYAKRYLTMFEERFCYDRFWYQDGESSESASRIMNCGYAFTYLGSGNDIDFFTNEFDGAPVAFRHIYVPMAIIAHFQKAALLVASRRLADLSPYGKDGKPQDLDPEAFESIEANFIAFTQTYWFDEITPQEQGIELFDMWRRELRLPQLYQEHRQELQDIVAFINGREAAKQTKAATNLNHYALAFALISIGLAFLGLLTGIIGMNEVPDKVKEVEGLTTEAFEWLSPLMPLWKILLIVCALAVTPYAIKRIKALKDSKLKNWRHP